MNDDQCYRALQGRDSRFDGWFVTAVRTTGIYCRPSCPAVLPKRENVTFYRSAAAAQQAGYRACRRCRPDATPGAPEWNERADVAGRAMRLIADGVVDRDGVAGLAWALGYTERQVNRVLLAELGAGPAALARSRRAQTARVLIETTSLPITDVAFAAGFASIRQFNDTIKEVFARTPTELRRRARGRHSAPLNGSITLRLPYRRPADTATTLRFLAARAVAGVEEMDGGVFRRSLRLPHGAGIVELAPADGYVAATLHLADLRNLAPAVNRCRRLLDLDADPVAVDAFLSADPDLRADVAQVPGLRVAGTVDGDELAMRALVERHLGPATPQAAASLAAVTAALGDPLADPVGGVTHLFPAPSRLADVDPDALPLDADLAVAFAGLAAELASGRLRLDPGGDRDRVERQLLALPGLDSWTAGYIRMRALDDHDVMLPIGSNDPAATSAEKWRPWRSYALAHLWNRRPKARRPKARRPKARRPKARRPNARRPKARRPATNPSVDTSERQPMTSHPSKHPSKSPSEHRPSNPRHTSVPSPIGPLLLLRDDGGLTGLYMRTDDYGPPVPEGSREDAAAFHDAAEQLAAYFGGDLYDFDLPLNPSGSPFQLKVWEALRTIPYGETRSYVDVARQIGQPTASRAVGLANGRNPISIVVPCHRVIGVNGSLTGYGGGLERKRVLLDLESSALFPVVRA